MSILTTAISEAGRYSIATIGRILIMRASVLIQWVLMWLLLLWSFAVSATIFICILSLLLCRASLLHIRVSPFLYSGIWKTYECASQSSDRSYYSSFQFSNSQYAIWLQWIPGNWQYTVGNSANKTLMTSRERCQNESLKFSLWYIMAFPCSRLNRCYFTHFCLCTVAYLPFSVRSALRIP